MNELLQSIRADLTSRRLLPLVALVAVALLGAVAYAVLGSGAKAKPPAPVQAAQVQGAGPTLPVAPAAPNPQVAASETPAGAHYQTHGATRNPFKSLTAPATKASSAPAASPQAGGASTTTGGSGGSGPSGNGGSGSSSGGGSGNSNVTKAAPKPAPGQKESKPAPAHKPKPQLLYAVSALFGPLPPPGQQPALTPYEEMRREGPLPSSKSPLLVFQGVGASGNAQFALIVAPILRGPGRCLPSEAQCQTIALAAGQAEELEYVDSSGQVSAYELQVLKIAKRNVPGASRAVHQPRPLRVSQAGLHALRAIGLLP